MFKLSSITMFGLLLVGALSGCANLCERQQRFYEKACAGTNIRGGVDYRCAGNLERCSERQLEFFSAYVGCLETIKECSLESISRCAQAYPAGVNLQC